ncbi:hypothetical protein Pve01_62750 [Planomonospora venezuelensis]|nr:hypothetical protein Pve01_62750 [Planomonospora venezuelensis]
MRDPALIVMPVRGPAVASGGPAPAPRRRRGRRTGDGGDPQARLAMAVIQGWTRRAASGPNAARIST